MTPSPPTESDGVLAGRALASSQRRPRCDPFAAFKPLGHEAGEPAMFAAFKPLGQDR